MTAAVTKTARLNVSATQTSAQSATPLTTASVMRCMTHMWRANLTNLYDEVLYDYQKEAASRIASQRRVLLADQPGLGKTLMVLAALERADLYRFGKNILVITPIINAQTAWIDSIEKFVKPRHDVHIVDVSRGTKSQKKKAMDTLSGMCNIIVANHNAVDWVEGNHRVDLRGIRFDAIIIDESHMVLPITSPKKVTNFWNGLMRIQSNEEPLLIAVSGTPDRGKLENRFGTWRFLEPRVVGMNRWQWLNDNFYMYEQKVSRTRTVKMVGSLRNKADWLAKDRAMMIRRTKNEVLSQLPPKQYVDVEIELYEAQYKEYRKLKESPIEPMVFATRARQLSNCQWSEEWEPLKGGKSAKLDWLVEWLDSRGYIDGSERGKVVIASQFSKVLHWLHQELGARGLQSAILDGSTPQSERDAVQRKFQDTASDLRIILLSGQMGVGITLDAADDLIMFDSPYDPDRVEQIEDRVHRASNMHHVMIWNLIGKATIDQAIMAKVSKRYTLTRSLLDGSRGIGFEKAIIDKLSTENVGDE